MASRLAVQLYTLREFLKTPADVARTLRRVREIGYENVQVSGLGPIAPAELRKILDGEGLRCVVTHGGLERFQKETAAVIDEHHVLGCSLTAIGGFWKENASADDWKAFAADYTKLAATFAAGGVRLGYHNHSHEWVRTGPGGRTPMEILLAECGRDVWFEIDTYWVQHGGGDPAAWIDRCFGRIPVVHLKDMAVVRKDGKTEPQMAEVGEGNLNWASILQACRRAGVSWFAVEQDVCQRDPFESIAISLRNLRAMGVE